MATVDVSARLQNFDEQYIPFPPFVAAMNAIEANLQMFREARVATHMLVTGEAGTGKSSLCRWLAHQHPRRVLPERDVVEILITAVPPLRPSPASPARCSGLSETLTQTRERSRKSRTGSSLSAGVVAWRCCYSMRLSISTTEGTSGRTTWWEIGSST